MSNAQKDTLRPMVDDAGPAERGGRFPRSAALPVILLVAIGTALVFHGVFWLLWTYARHRF
jgi:hypothetical protein